MLNQDQWGAIRALAKRGLGKKAIARKLGLDPKTVRNSLNQKERPSYRRRHPVMEVLERDHGEYLQLRAPAVNYSAQVLFQEVRARGFAGSYPTVMRWVRPRREECRRLEQATVRFETGPGRQGQVDWGSTMLEIGGAAERAHLFVMALGFSRRIFVRGYAHERLAALLDGHERAFQHFGGRTEELLYDNPRTIVMRRDREGKKIAWHPTFRDFADTYGFTPRVCRPYRARTKGKVESGVKYVKRNALAGRSFRSWDDLNDWLITWAATIADRRVHGTTHEKPVDRFRRESLIPVHGLAPYRMEQNARKVASDCLINLDTNRYSVPWQLVGERVEIAVVQHEVQIRHRGKMVAAHLLCSGRHQVIRQKAHYQGLFRTERQEPRPASPGLLWSVSLPEVEVRDLQVYEALAGGAA